MPSPIGRGDAGPNPPPPPASSSGAPAARVGDNPEPRDSDFVTWRDFNASNGGHDDSFRTITQKLDSHEAQINELKNAPKTKPASPTWVKVAVPLTGIAALGLGLTAYQNNYGNGTPGFLV